MSRLSFGGTVNRGSSKLEARGGIEPTNKALQTLPFLFAFRAFRAFAMTDRHSIVKLANLVLIVNLADDDERRHTFLSRNRRF
jgi:hypothetical protein